MHQSQNSSFGESKMTLVDWWVIASRQVENLKSTCVFLTHFFFPKEKLVCDFKKLLLSFKGFFLFVFGFFFVNPLASDFFVGKEEIGFELWGNFVAYEGSILKGKKSKREDLQRELSCFLRNCRCFWGKRGRRGCTPGKNSFSGKCFRFHSSKHRYRSVILLELLKWAKRSQLCNKEDGRTGAFPLG